MIARESIYVPLFNMLNTLLAPGAVPASPGVDAIPGAPTSTKPFNLVSREVIEIQRVPPLLQPVLFMDEVMEQYVQAGDGLYYHRWTVFFHVGCCGGKGVAMSTILNPLIDVVENLFLSAIEGNLIGLGDTLARAQFFGVSPKDLANNSTKPEYRQAGAYMPFEIIFPAS